MRIVMLFLVIFVGYGFWVGKKRYQADTRYWTVLALCVAVHLASGVLFAGYGTLENPEGDGIVTRIIRKATNDGPAVALVGLAAIGFAYFVPFAFWWKESARIRRSALAKPIADVS